MAIKTSSPRFSIHYFAERLTVAQTTDIAVEDQRAVAALGPTPPPFGRRRNVPISSLLRRNPTKIIPFILVSVLSAASACYAADPTLDGGHISSGAPTHGVVLHLHGCDGLVRSGVIGEWLSRLRQMGFKVYAPNSFAERRPPVSCKPPFPNKREIYALRLDQTIRVIKELRTKHPESKRPLLWLFSTTDAAVDDHRRKIRS